VDGLWAVDGLAMQTRPAFFLFAKIYSTGEPNTLRRQLLHIPQANTVARQQYPTISGVFPLVYACAPAVAKKKVRRW
jgi:hypothetical protein